MHTYELVYVVSPDASEDQVAELHILVEEIVQELSGTIEKTENLGRRRLAYKIGSHREATYVLEVIVGSGELMTEIDRRLKVSDLVIRHLVVRVDEEAARIERVRARRAATMARRRGVRGLSPERQPGEGQRAEGEQDPDNRPAVPPAPMAPVAPVAPVAVPAVPAEAKS
jgi:small subunit ribosomal protein S6